MWPSAWGDAWLAFAGGEEALGNGVFVARAGRTHGGPDAGLAAAGAEVDLGGPRALELR